MRPRGNGDVSQVMGFETFEIRVAERQVLVKGEPVALGARAFDVLLALAERCDRVVSKAELLDLAWSGLVVEENNLTVQIWALRRALGPGSIATVTGRGYRLQATPRHATPQAPAVVAGRLERRLATIAQADVVGWAKTVARNPVQAAQAWRRLRTELIEPSAQRHGGRAIELTAERIQLEFCSAVEALAWAMEVQGLLAGNRQSAGAADAPALHLRIGIAVDDVIVDDGKLVGDGVHVAADLQLCAGPDEVLTTSMVADLVSHKLDARLEPLGERLLQRLQRPLPVWRVGTSARPADTSALSGEGVLSRVASVAVLPFAAGDGMADQAYFGDGVTEEIIATLSLNRALFVIAHSSTLRYRQRDDLSSVGEELGVRYLVSGRVRRSGARMRIHVSLASAQDQRVLWQEAFDGGDEDLFRFQSDIAAQVAAAVAPQVQDEEVSRLRHRPTSSYGAYDCVLRGLDGLYQLGTPEFDTAGAMFRRAIELDPGYAQAHAHLAWWYSLRHAEGRSAVGADEGRLALDHALQAIRLDARDAWALSVAGYMLSLQRKQHLQALEMFDQALALNPSCAAAWARSAATLCYLGRADESIERVQRALSLSPFDQHMFWYLTIRGGACFVAGRYDEAVGWLGKALRLNPRFNGARRIQIAALALTGVLGEAGDLAKELVAEFADFSVAEFGRWSPMVQPHLDTLLDGLRRAGLPD